MNPFHRLIVLLILALFFTACQPAAQSLVPKAAEPQSGKATVTGQLMKTDGSTPHAQTIVRLAEIYRQGGEGAFVLDGSNSPGATTDENGYFVISDITAGEYVFVVGDPLAVYVIISDESGKAKTWKAPADEVTDFGVITVDYQ